VASRHGTFVTILGKEDEIDFFRFVSVERTVLELLIRDGAQRCVYVNKVPMPN